ncbi:MAG: hypothetical protein ACRDGN_09510, partial [bacterium]
MRRSNLVLLWAVVATGLLTFSVVMPDATRATVGSLSQAWRLGTWETATAQAQTQDSPAQLEW